MIVMARRALSAVFGHGYIAVLLIALILVGWINAAALVRSPRGGPEMKVRAILSSDADSLDATLRRLDQALDHAQRNDTGTVRLAFRVARARYKRLEAMLEFYSPQLASSFNSRRAEVDDDDAPPPSSLAPSGFPALEVLLGTTFTSSQRDSARHILAGMRPLVSRVRAMQSVIVPTDAQVLELTRLELARITTLDIAGFDAPKTGDAMRECAESLLGMKELLDSVGADRWSRYDSQRAAVDSTFDAAIAYLRTHPDFATFDRFAFITEHGEPAARSLDALRRAVNARPIEMRRALRSDAPSPYVANAFDPRAYAPNTSPLPTRDLIALGERLFNNPALSGTGTRSCASCHVPDRAFADGLAHQVSLDSRLGSITRNTPTLINAALQPAQLADERAATLEDQIIDVLGNPLEMGSSITRASTAVGMAPLALRQTLAAYVRSLVSLDSRFDRAVRGEPTLMTAQEKAGFNLFMGKAGCGTCHFAPLFNGTAPPLYVGSDVEVIGTSVTSHDFAALDPDSGRARIDHRAEHLRAFKVPSLRNVTVTAPYMHHGAFATLDDVLRFYDAGGARGAGARIGNQTLAPDSLHLTTTERAAIIAFLGTLTDTSRRAVARP